MPGDKPYVVVEVETNVAKYGPKIESLWDYLSKRADFSGLESALLVMTNGYVQSNKKAKRHKHNWEAVKEKVRTKKHCVALVSIEKSNANLDGSVLSHLRGRNGYYHWDIANIDYWVFDGHTETGDNLWKQ